MDASVIKQAIECISSGDANQALEVLKNWITSAAGGDVAPPEPDDEAASVAADDHSADGDQPGAEGNGAEGVPAPKKTKSGTESPVVNSAIGAINRADIQRGRKAFLPG